MSDPTPIQDEAPVKEMVGMYIAYINICTYMLQLIAMEVPITQFRQKLFDLVNQALEGRKLGSHKGRRLRLVPEHAASKLSRITPMQILIPEDFDMNDPAFKAKMLAEMEKEWQRDWERDFGPAPKQAAPTAALAQERQEGHETVIVYLDTNAAVFLAQRGIARFHPRARRLIEHGSLRISPMVLLELEYMSEVGRSALRGQDIYESWNKSLVFLSAICLSRTWPELRSRRNGPATHSTALSWPTRLNGLAPLISSDER